MPMMRPSLAAAACLTASLAMAQAETPMAADFLAIWDANRDGLVTPEEAEMRRKEVFQAFDLDGDGDLGGEEYAILDEDIEAELGASRALAGADEDAETREMLSAAMARAETDADGDGRVTQAEFAGRSSNWFARMDRDNDGAITLLDFGSRR